MPGDVDVLGLGEVEREPSPAAPEIEHALPGPEQQLAREVPLLRVLGLLQRHLRIGEERARALAIPVEEMVVEDVREVVGGPPASATEARPRASRRCQNASDAPRERAGRLGAGGEARQVARAEVEQVVDVAPVDRERAVHVGVAEVDREGLHASLACRLRSWSLTTMSAARPGAPNRWVLPLASISVNAPSRTSVWQSRARSMRPPGPASCAFAHRAERWQAAYLAPAGAPRRGRGWGWSSPVTAPGGGGLYAVPRGPTGHDTPVPPMPQ